ncbi:MAG: TolC family protein [Candidatus Omnitrophica bacterium]|nr:TolC family protein [Candidatus Omnitrophota bacterium]
MRGYKILVFLLFTLIFCLPSFAQQTLTWQDCLAESQKNNPDLISAEESVRQSQASRQVTRSGLFPQVTSSASASRTAASSNGESVKTNSYSYGANVSQLIFDGMKTPNDLAAAKENVKASQQSYRFASSQIRLRLRTAFVNLLKAQGLIAVTRDIAQIRKSERDLIALRYQSGLEHKGALLNAEANLASAEFEINQAKRDVVLAQRQLNKEMGWPEFAALSVSGDFSVKDTGINKNEQTAASAPPDFAAIASRHPTVLQAAAQENAAAFSVASARGSFFPKLTGQAGADRAGHQWAPKDDSWDAGLTVSMPIFDGGQRTGQLAQAKAVLNKAAADSRSARDGIVVALVNNWNSLQDNLELVTVREKALTAAQERAKIAEAEYSAGFITYDNWSIIEDTLVGAKKTYLDAQANALLAEANWIQAKGETLE